MARPSDERRVRLVVSNGICELRLNRPEKLNALDPAMFTGLAEAIGRIGRTAGVRAVVLSGEGPAFSAGLDMASMAAGGAGSDLDRRDYGLVVALDNALEAEFLTKRRGSRDPRADCSAFATKNALVHSIELKATS